LVATNTVKNEFPKEDLTATKGNWLRYVYTATSNETINVKMNGGTGDADLYVNKNGETTASTYICRPYAKRNNESCTIPMVAGETIYIGIKAFTTFTGTTLNVAQ
jgi:serine protease